MIYLLPITLHCEPFLEQISILINRYTGLGVETIRTDFSPQFAFDSARNQYHSTRIIQDLTHLSFPKPHKIVAITSFDLFIPILTYVFGEAQLGGRIAIVSSFRLNPELQGLPSDPDLVIDRVAKECNHEIGHTFSLRHCFNDQCVMHASTYVEEIDLKPAYFCPACHEIFNEQKVRQSFLD